MVDREARLAEYMAREALGDVLYAVLVEANDGDYPALGAFGSCEPLLWQYGAVGTDELFSTDVELDDNLEWQHVMARAHIMASGLLARLLTSEGQSAIADRIGDLAGFAEQALAGSRAAV
jgi:hypothetical protein